MLIRHLEFFVTLAEERHFGRAADLCGVSQPALSLAVRKLEEDLGAPLVLRGARFAGLTAEGEKVLLWGRQILADFGHLRDDLSGRRKGGLTGTLRLGVSASAMPYLPRFSERFEARNPLARLRAETLAPERIRAGLADFSLDGALGWLPAEARAQAGPGALAGALAQAGPKAPAGTGAQAETGTQVGTGAQTGTGALAGTGALGGTGAQADVRSQAGLGRPAGIGGQAGTGRPAGIGGQAAPLAGFPLWPGRLRFACRADHPFASGGPLTLQDAATQPLCLAEDLPLPLGLRPAVLCGGLDGALAHLRAGRWCSLVPEGFAALLAPGDDLVLLDLDGLDDPGPIGAYLQPRDPQPPLQRAFQDCAAALAAEAQA